jgi:hypothetical protein
MLESSAIPLSPSQKREKNLFSVQIEFSLVAIEEGAWILAFWNLNI